MMASSQRSSLLLPLVSGAALWLSFPNVSWFWLAWLGLIPYLYFLIQAPDWRRLVVGHLLFSLAYFGGVLYWIPRVLVVYGDVNWFVAGAVFLLLPLLLGTLLFPFALLTRVAAVKSPRLALFCAPGFWMLTELFRNYYPFNGFPWALLGYSQYPYHWISQLADISGVYLISFLIVLTNSALLALVKLRDWKFFGVCAALLFLANSYGMYRVHLWNPPAGEHVRVALVQPDIALAEDREHYALKYFEELPGFYKRASQEGAQWVIFPEAQNPYSYQHDFYFTTFWERQVAQSGAYLLFNTTMVEGNQERYFNSAVLLNPEGQAAYRYDKTHLVPFGEYVPLERWLRFVEPLVHEVSSFTPGKSFVSGVAGGVPFATLICFEGIFPEIAREFVRNGSELLVIITNDAWYGQTAAPRQHLEIAVFRAIENRRPVLRAANSGYSAVIDSRGRIESQLGLFETGMLTADVRGSGYRSFYSYFGEWLNLGLIGGTFAIWVFGKPYKARKKPRRR
jgi:apolipoprotein N-acyltransferase